MLLDCREVLVNAIASLALLVLLSGVPTPQSTNTNSGLEWPRFADRLEGGAEKAKPLSEDSLTILGIRINHESVDVAESVLGPSQLHRQPFRMSMRGRHMFRSTFARSSSRLRSSLSGLSRLRKCLGIEDPP